MDRNEDVESASGSTSAPISSRSRDPRAAGVPTTDSSRGLLFTVLGEFVLPADGRAWTQSLAAALELVGVRDKAARQAIARTEERGWLDRTRVGRQTRWSLTARAHSVLEPGAERIYTFGCGAHRWDARWLLVLASVPESDRATRYRMAQSLNWSGVGSLGQGVWLSPWIDREPSVVESLQRLGVDATVFTAEVASLGSPEELAAVAWDLDALRTQYDEFLADTAELVATADDTGDAAAAARLISLVHRWRRFPLLDPDLPLELLPDDWPGPAAAERFGAARTALLPAARRWWRDIERQHTPA